jgi:hypothetical protein
MRELTANEIFEVGGAAGLNFSSPINATTMNSVANATAAGRMVGLAFGVGYAIGTYLNERYSLSTRIVDLLT